MSYEHAPWKNKGKYTGIVQAGFPVGLLLANLVFLVSVHLGGELGLARAVPGQHRPGHRRPDHPLQGPRVPGLRRGQGQRRHRQVPDHRGHQDRLAQHRARHRPSHRRDRRLRRVHHLHDLLPPDRSSSPTRPRPWSRSASPRPSASSPPIAWARLTDRIGRRPLYSGSAPSPCCSASRCSCWSTPACSSSSSPRSSIAYAVFQNSLAGAQGAWFPELFKANTRSSGASLAYQISAIVSGFTPFVTTLLFVSFGWMGPALLFSFYAAIGLWAADRHPRNLGPARAPARRRGQQKHPRVGERLMAATQALQTAGRVRRR